MRASTLIITGAAALIAPPAARHASRGAPTMAVDGLVGATKPMGYFDPLGLSKGKSLEQMKQFREAELKPVAEYVQKNQLFNF